MASADIADSATKRQYLLETSDHTSSPEDKIRANNQRLKKLLPLGNYDDLNVETPVSSPSELKEAVTKALEAKATDVCDLKEKLRESELARKSSENEAAKLKLRADQLSDDYATLAQEKKDLQDELDKKNALLGREQGRRANLEKKLEDAQTESLEKLGQLEDLKDALNGEKELRHKNEDKLDEQIFMYKTTLEVRDNELMNEIAKAKNIAEEAKKKDEEHIKFRHGMTERHRMNENFLKNLVNKGLDKVKDLELKLASAEAQCDILKPEMDKLKGENDRLNKDLDAARKEANKAEKEKDKFEKLYTDENAECRTLQDDLIKLKLTDKLDLIDLDHVVGDYNEILDKEEARQRSTSGRGPRRGRTKDQNNNEKPEQNLL